MWIIALWSLHHMVNVLKLSWRATRKRNSEGKTECEGQCRANSWWNWLVHGIFLWCEYRALAEGLQLKNPTKCSLFPTLTTSRQLHGLYPFHVYVQVIRNKKMFRQWRFLEIFYNENDKNVVNSVFTSFFLYLFSFFSVGAEKEHQKTLFLGLFSDALSTERRDRVE
jgi:hypothetical protein